jgi:hypothetical protein
MNLSIVPVYGMILTFTFLHALSYFAMIANELSILLHMAHQLIFATLPLVSSTLLSIYLCEEVVAFELTKCFSIIYFLYIYFLCPPRYVYITGYVKSGSRVTSSVGINEKMLLPEQVMRAVYILPIPLSLIIHIALHYNLLTATRSSVLSLAQAVLLPCLLMLVSYRRHLNYQRQLRSDQRVDRKARTDNYISLIVSIYALSIVDHPMFDDLRRFGRLEEPLPTYVMLGLVLALLLSALFIRRIQAIHNLESDMNMLCSSGSTQSWLLTLRLCLCTSVGMAAVLLCALIGMPFSKLPICLLGAVTLTELYFQPKDNRLYHLVLVFVAFWCLMAPLATFYESTVYYITFSIAWHVDLSMANFGSLLIWLTIFSALVPVMLDPKFMHRAAMNGLLPLASSSSSSSNSSGHMSQELRLLFTLLFVVLSVSTAALELMVLEQVRFIPSYLPVTVPVPDRHILSLALSRIGQRWG